MFRNLFNKLLGGCVVDNKEGSILTILELTEQQQYVSQARERFNEFGDYHDVRPRGFQSGRFLYKRLQIDTPAKNGSK